MRWIHDDTMSYTILCSRHKSMKEVSVTKDTIFPPHATPVNC